MAMITKAAAKKIANVVRGAVEHELLKHSGPARKSPAAKHPNKTAHETAQDRAPVKGDTLEAVLRAGRRSGIWSKAMIEFYEKSAREVPNATVAERLRRSMRSDLELHGVRFK